MPQLNYFKLQSLSPPIYVHIYNANIYIQYILFLVVLNLILNYLLTKKDNISIFCQTKLMR